jgi:hypothetical protein
MNEKYINDLYSQLGGEEVFGKYEDFVNLITNDDSYIKDFHGNFGEETLGSLEDFTNLVKKKDETTELVSPQEEVVTTSDTEEVETPGVSDVSVSEEVVETTQAPTIRP